MNDTIVTLADRLPGEARSLTLATACAELSPSERRFLSIFAPLAAALAKKGSRHDDLFLLDTPFGVGASYQKEVVRCIKDLEAQGATIVCAGVPKTLESLFASVVRLRFVRPTREGEPLSRHFDARMARRVEAHVEVCMGE